MQNGECNACALPCVSSDLREYCAAITVCPVPWCLPMWRSVCTRARVGCSAVYWGTRPPLTWTLRITATLAGRFSHKGSSITIATGYNWADGGHPNSVPLYMSSNGYGVYRNTWAPAVYDFENTATSQVGSAAPCILPHALCITLTLALYSAPCPIPNPNPNTATSQVAH